MKIEIDTENKTIKVLGSVAAHDLLDYIHNHELHEYVVVGHEEDFKYPWPSLPPQERFNPESPIDYFPKYGKDTGRPTLEW